LEVQFLFASPRRIQPVCVRVCAQKLCSQATRFAEKDDPRRKALLQKQSTPHNANQRGEFLLSATCAVHRSWLVFFLWQMVQFAMVLSSPSADVVIFLIMVLMMIITSIITHMMAINITVITIEIYMNLIIFIIRRPQRVAA
jgi:hypothetical protein